MLFKYAVALPPHIPVHTLSLHIEPDCTSNGSNSTYQQGTSNRNFKICHVALSITKNYYNKITLGKAVNALMKVIHVIEVDSKKVKKKPCQSKQPNLEVLKYIKDGKFPEAEFGKYLYAVREGQYI